MRNCKSYFLSFLFISVLSIIASAQSVRYVAYFPVPYITHEKIEANTAMFAGKDNAVVTVGGTLKAYNLSSEKDLELRSTSTSPIKISGLYAGSIISNMDEDSWRPSGNFTVMGKGSHAELLNAPTAMDNVNVGELKADTSLSLKEIKWISGSNTNNAFVRGGTNGFPSGTTKLCWSPLRLRGSYEYQYYLIAISSGNCW